MAYPGLVFGIGILFAVGAAAIALLYGNSRQSAHTNEEPYHDTDSNYTFRNSWDEDEVRRRRRNNCSICLDSMKDQRNTLISVCNHVFHTKCINMWRRTQSASTCPLCRIPFSAENLASC